MAKRNSPAGVRPLAQAAPGRRAAPRRARRARAPPRPSGPPASASRPRAPARRAANAPREPRRRRAPAGAVAPAAAVGAADPGRRGRHGDRLAAEARRRSAAAPLLVAGIAAVAIGTVEVTLREHLGGYRSHTLLLALLPAIVLPLGGRCSCWRLHAVPRWVNIALLAIDIALFACSSNCCARASSTRAASGVRRLTLSVRAADAAARAGPRASSSSEGSGRSPSAAPSPRVSPLKPSRSQARDLALAFDARRVAGGQAGDQVRDAVAQLQREVGRRGAHQLAHVLDGHLAGALLALHARGSSAWLNSGSVWRSVCSLCATEGSSPLCLLRADLQQRVDFGLRDRRDRALRRRSASRDCRRPRTGRNAGAEVYAGWMSTR